MIQWLMLTFCTLLQEWAGSTCRSTLLPTGRWYSAGVVTPGARLCGLHVMTGAVQLQAHICTAHSQIQCRMILRRAHVATQLHSCEAVLHLAGGSCGFRACMLHARAVVGTVVSGDQLCMPRRGLGVPLGSSGLRVCSILVCVSGGWVSASGGVGPLHGSAVCAPHTVAGCAGCLRGCELHLWTAKPPGSCLV